MVLASAAPAFAEDRIRLGGCAIGPAGGGAVCMPTGLDTAGFRQADRGSLSYYGVQSGLVSSRGTVRYRSEWTNLGGIAMRYKGSDRSQTLDVVVLAAPFGD